MKALVGSVNQEKALLGAFSVIVQLHRLIVYTALLVMRDLGWSGAECPHQAQAGEKRVNKMALPKMGVREP